LFLLHFAACLQSLDHFGEGASRKTCGTDKVGNLSSRFEIVLEKGYVRHLVHNFLLIELHNSDNDFSWRVKKR